MTGFAKKKMKKKRQKKLSNSVELWIRIISIDISLLAPQIESRLVVARVRKASYAFYTMHTFHERE